MSKNICWLCLCLHQTKNPNPKPSRQMHPKIIPKTKAILWLLGFSEPWRFTKVKIISKVSEKRYYEHERSVSSFNRFSSKILLLTLWVTDQVQGRRRGWCPYALRLLSSGAYKWISYDTNNSRKIWSEIHSSVILWHEIKIFSSCLLESFSYQFRHRSAEVVVRKVPEEFIEPRQRSTIELYQTCTKR